MKSSSSSQREGDDGYRFRTGRYWWFATAVANFDIEPFAKSADVGGVFSGCNLKLGTYPKFTQGPKKHTSLEAGNEYCKEIGIAKRSLVP